ncbi:hypothetical protein PPS11_29128 [Pseudomonas putida S11]|nr:hypothetical protein PPS11_29128 [Pseudomonas putida S11]
MKSRSAGSQAMLQPRLEVSGVWFFVDVLAVQVHAGFQAQGIAGTKAAGGDAGTDQVVEEGHGLLAGEG